MGRTNPDSSDGRALPDETGKSPNQSNSKPLLATVRAPARSLRGITGWERGPNLPCVKVHHVRLMGAKVPALDGTEVSAEADETASDGLRWKNVGDVKPKRGTELVNAALSNALRTKHEFTQPDWEALGVKNLRSNHFIHVGGTYFQPDEMVRFEPPENGTLVLVVGMGGGKTWRTVEWLSGHTELPIVVVTARKNLACKIEADLCNSGLDPHNYLNASAQQRSVKAWCRHPVVIISGEQVHTLIDWLDMYGGGTLVIDEFGTLAASFGGQTIWEPETTMTALNQLARVCARTILMDADADIDGKCEAFLRGFAPMNDVLYVQSAAPAMKRTLLFGFKSNDRHVLAFNEWFEYSLFRSRAARRAGTPNRTFYGGTTRNQVIDRARQATSLGVLNACYHGKSSECERKRDFADADRHMEQYDAIFASTVMSIGTDLSLKCSWGFFETAKGSARHGVSLLRMLAQLMGRPGRSAEAPLDGVQLGDRELPGALFVLIDDTPPEVYPADTKAPTTDRVDRKFQAMIYEERERQSAMRRADDAAVDSYRTRHGLCIETDVGTSRGVSDNAVATQPGIEKALAEIRAWNDVEQRDNYQCHTLKLFELCVLPTRAFDLVPMEALNDVQRRELDDFRHQEKDEPAQPVLISEDRRVADERPAARYALVMDDVLGREQKRKPLDEAIAAAKERISAALSSEGLDEETKVKVSAECSEMQRLVEERRTLGNESGFWFDCDGRAPKGGNAQPILSGIGGAFKEVWEVLKDLHEFVPPDVYGDLYADHQGGRNVLNRALMRFVPEEDLQVAQVRARRFGHAGDASTYKSLPASHKLPLLRKFAASVGLGLDDLLEPRTFTAEDHAWVSAYNRIQAGEDTEDDRATAEHARTCAVELGCAGIRRGERATGLRKTIGAVLEQQCAMKPATKEEDGLVTIRPGARRERKERLVSWCVEEVAPGYAERMLVFHPDMREYVPAAEYRSSGEAWFTRRNEEEREARERLERARYEIELGDWEPQEAEDQGHEQIAEPFVPSVRYVPFEDAKIRECLEDWRSDEVPRRVAEEALLELITRAQAARDDGLLRKLRGRRKALRKLSARHKMLAQLDKTLPPPDTDGRRTQREEYEYKALSLGKGRYYAKGRWCDFGDGELRSLSFQGLPSDLRTKLCGKYFHDADGFCSDLKLYLHEAKVAGLPRSMTKHCRSYAESRQSRDAWHARVAQWHAERLGCVVDPSAIKRWPNILGNGGGYAKCLEAADLPSDADKCPEVVALQEELRRLRDALLRAPCNRDYVEAERAHLARELPQLTEYERDNKVFAYLIETSEDRVLHLCDATFRRLAREATGAHRFDHLPAKYRDTGAFVYDGQATEARGGLDMAAALRQAEAELAAQGIDYTLDLKPLHGRQDEPMASVAAARMALTEAMAEHPEVRTAVERGAAGKKRTPTTVSASPGANKKPQADHEQAAFVLLMRDEDAPSALLTVERRNGVVRLGLLGGKAKPEDHASTLATAAREAHEETHALLSTVTRDNIKDGRRMWGQAGNAQCKARVYVHAVEGEADLDLDTRWPLGAELNTDPSSKTIHLGVRWVALDCLLDAKWRTTEMHTHAAMLVGSAAAVLRRPAQI